MSGKSTRKGAAGEREVMAILREHGYSVERGGTQFYRQRPDLYGLDGVHMEIKRCERAQIWEWMQQAERDAQRFGDGAPAVFFRRSRSPWMVTMKLSDWIPAVGFPGYGLAQMIVSDNLNELQAGVMGTLVAVD